MKRLLIASLLTVITAGSTLGMATTASAHPRSPGIDRREARQQNRIFQGVRSGALTPRETYRLERQQASIRAQEAQFKSDGRLTHRERTILQNRLDRSSRNIYRAKHNNRHF